ncbi:MAG: DUF2779 domain-containing protein [Gemmatimonadota bacterium]|nr:DUF2779 domain-containing protein [Gemmatimonadota bacterium]
MTSPRSDAPRAATERPLIKRVFLDALVCLRRGWLLHNPEGDRRPPGPGDQFQFAQGHAVGDRARELFGPGVDLRGPATAEWMAEGRRVVDDAQTRVAYEVPLAARHAVARPDVLVREAGGWRVIEVKSGKSEKTEYIDDLAYTVAVTRAAELPVVGAELALVNAEWRLGGDQPALVRLDVTEDVLARSEEFLPLLEAVHGIVTAAEAPAAELKSACRKCEFRGARCFVDGPRHPVFELPNIRSRRVDEWIAGGITRIRELPETEKLTAVQQLHRRAVVSNALVTDAGALARLAEIEEPAGYLDFETLSLALPPFPGVAPFDVLPIQYSLHRRTAEGDTAHRELLVDPAAPDVEEFARDLLDALAGVRSIVVYSSFEKQRLQWLAQRLPALASGLEAAAGRLFDLLPVVQAAVAHPEFHGSLSIKRVLPVLVPELTYAGLEIGDGENATGVAGLRALGRLGDEEWARVRPQLLAYCKLDTFAMVRLHEALRALPR